MVAHATSFSQHHSLVKKALSQIPTSGLDKLHYHLVCKRPVLLTGGIESFNFSLNASTY